MVEVLSLITVRIRNGFCHVNPSQALHLGLDGGFLEDLSDRTSDGMLTGFNDARDGGPTTVVGPSDEQDPGVIAQHHCGDTRKPEKIVTNVGTKPRNEVRHRHLGTLSARTGIAAKGQTARSAA